LVGLELVAQHQIVEPWHRVIVSRTRYVQEGGGSIEQALRTESRAALWRRGQSH
jgi:alkylated DNA nucleotide flippase Atl1